MRTTVHATPGYEQRVRNLSRTSFTSDNVFGDSGIHRLATVTGDVSTGHVANLTIGV